MEIKRNTLVATTLLVGLVFIVGLVGGIYTYSKKEAEINSLLAEKAHSETIMNLKDSVMIDMDNSFFEIENSLKSIKEKRNHLALLPSEGSKSRKQAIIDDIKLLDDLMEENNKKIAELEQKLKKSGLNLKSYEKRLQSLTETIESQNYEIAELKKLVESKNMTLAEMDSKVKDLSTNMAKQSDTINFKQKVIVERTDKLNTAHVKVGTFKELKAEGILDREGGLLGIGSNKAIQENFDPSHFTTLDIRQTKMIPINNKKATLISEHPNNSYSLVEENGQVAYLEIKDPQEFWRISKYAVIQVK